MQRITHKIILGLAGMALIAGSIFVFRPEPTFAVLGAPDAVTSPVAPGVPLGIWNIPSPLPQPTLVMGDLWGSFVQGVIKAAESAGYTIIRKYVRQGLANLTKDVWKQLLTGGKGQSEVFEIEPWDNFWQTAGDEAFGSAVEGFAQGFQNEYEASQKKAQAIQNLEIKEDAALQSQVDASVKLYEDLESCENKYTDRTSLEYMQYCGDITKAIEKANTDYNTTATNSFTGQRRTLAIEKSVKENEATALRNEYNRLRDEYATCVQKAKDDGIPQTGCAGKLTESQAKNAELVKIETELGTYDKKLSDVLRSADAATAAAVRAIDLEANKKDAALIAGNTGALTEVSKTLIDIVCKPSIDVSLGIFLGLGDQIEQTKRTALCPYKKIKENWQELANNTGTQLNEASLDGWRTIAGLVNPNTSDLAAAYGISISGRSVSDIAKTLGVTQFMSEQAQGGMRALTDFSGKTTTPAGLVRSVAENSLKVQIEEDTRFIPTGHLLADLILTAGQTVLSTSLNILKDGLRKQQAVARNGSKAQGSAFAALTNRANVLYSPGSNPSFGGRESAEARLVDFSKLDLSPSGDWNVLARLTSSSCPEQVEGGMKGGDLDACVMDDKFAQAVKERITVAEALAPDRLLLNGNGIFGFDFGDIDGAPVKTVSWQDNFPYRSLVIMRKYRVLPVSWELAALFIQDDRNRTKVITECGRDACTLNELIAKFNDKKSVFYGMIDPNWVLKVPPVWCALKGFGSEVQGEPSSTQECVEFDALGACLRSKEVKTVIRAPEQCVDYQTCLDEDEDGKCKAGRFGYCLQEQKIIRFKGETCDEKFVGCEAFQDAVTKQSASYIKTSLADYGSGKCIPANAGCRWFSVAKKFQPYTYKNAQNTVVTDATKVALNADKQARIRIEASAAGVNTQQEWSSAISDRAFLATSSEDLQKCQPEAEGCREVSGVSGMSYLRLPPSSYECDKDGVDPYGNIIPWYKRAECKQFTAVCKQQFVGCEQYTPSDDTFSVTGISSDDSAATPPYQYRCPAQCAGIKNFTVEKTLFDTVQPPAENFSADNATKCSISDVGCEEFTNVNVAAAGGEGKEYYTFMQQCVQLKAEDVPAKEVFLSFVGSEQAGGQPVKQYVVGTTAADGKGDGAAYDTSPATWSPKCADSSKPCDCTVTDVNKNMNDPRIGTILCREFINSSGKSFYRYTDNLIYYGTDCTAFRRTLDGATATDTLYSQSLSKRCSAPSAVNCREYHAPTAGNIRVLYPEGYSNFEDGDVNGWSVGDGSDFMENKVTSIGEILGDHSLKIQKKSTYTGDLANALAVKKINFRRDYTYSITFNIKGASGYVLKAFIGAITGSNTETISIGSDKTLNGNWQRIQYSVDKNVLQDKTFDSTELMVMVGAADVSDFTIDDIIVKETDGIEYLIKDSWEKNGMCFSKTSDTDPTPNFNSIAYPGCSLYTDKQGGQHAIQKFEKICPLEMAGCVEGAQNTSSVDFEKGSLGLWDTPTTRQNSSIISEGGRKFLRVNNSAQRSISSYVPLFPHTAYTIRFDIRLGTATAKTLLLHTAFGASQITKDIGENTDWQPVEFSFVQSDSTGNPQLTNMGGNFDIDNIVVEKQLYLIPDPSKQCSAQDNKCTAYGSPKLLTKTDGSESLKTIKNLVQDNTQNEWKEKEDWNIAYYKVTPEESFIAQAQFKNGDTSGYNSGICRAANPSTADKGDLGCREYLAGSKGDKTYFRDPGVRYYQPPQPGGRWWFVNTCETSREIMCRQDSDCPLTNGQQEKCDTRKENIGFCHIASSRPCAADAECRAASGNGTDACIVGRCDNNSDQTCNDDTNCGTGRCVQSISLPQSCPAQASGCRLIKDPECKDDGTLRSDYGRGGSGVPCTQKYHFTGNLDDQNPDCNGQINVEKGCLLFNDTNRQAFIYQKDAGSAGIPLTNSQFSTTPPTYCRCDTNAASETDCRDTGEPALVSDPPECYNKYSQSVSNVGVLLRKYTKVQTDLQFNSVGYYARSRIYGSVSKGDPSVPAVNLDANVVLKVKQDRQCKAWLTCKSSWSEGDKEICWEQQICTKWESPTGSKCAQIVPSIAGSLGDVAGEWNDGAPKPTVLGGSSQGLTSLSGLARPDYLFPNVDADNNAENNFITSGGYSYRFGEAVQRPEANVRDRTYMSLEIPSRANRGKSKIINSCRLYPRQTTNVSSVGNVVDSCRVEGGSWGVYGFCLEPYPNYKKAYYDTDNYYHKVCTNQVKECSTDADCPGGQCGFNYFDNACLTWLPVDRIEGQQNLFSSGKQREMSVYNGSAADVHYCFKTETKKEYYDASGNMTLVKFAPKNTPRPQVQARFSEVASFPNPLQPGARCNNGRFSMMWSGETSFNNCPAVSDFFNSDTTNRFILYAPMGIQADYFVTANDKEKVLKRKDFASVEYFVESGVQRYGGTNPQFRLQNASDSDPARDDGHGDLASVVSVAVDETPVFKIIGSSADAENVHGSAVRQHTDNEITSTAATTLGSGTDAVVFTIQPYFENDSSDPGAAFKGWIVYSFKNTNDTLFYYTVSININQTPTTYSEKAFVLSYDKTYCKSYVTVVKGGEAVPDRTIDSFDAERMGAVQLPEDRSKATGQVIYKATNFKWENCNPETLKELKETDKDITMPPDVLDRSQFTCTTIPSSFKQFVDNNRIDGPTNKNISVIGTDPDLLKSFDFIRTKTPFQKVYEFWEWQSNGTFAIQAHWDKGSESFVKDNNNTGALNLIQNFWVKWPTWTSPEGTVDRASKPATAPVIYGAVKDSGHKDKFEYERTGVGQNTLKLWFYIDVPNKAQLPIREISIDWGDGTPASPHKLTVEKSNTDGRGVVNIPPPFVAESPNIFSGYGPYIYQYNANKPLAGKTVCVKVVDNWGGIGRACKQF